MEPTLAPLTVGGCLIDTLNHVSKQWRAWISSALVYHFFGGFGLIILIIMPFVLVFFVVGLSIKFTSAASGGKSGSAMVMLLFWLLVGLVGCLPLFYFGAIASLGKARLALRALRGEPTTSGEVFHYARAPGTALFLFLLNMVITLTLLCLGIIPSLFLFSALNERSNLLLCLGIIPGVVYFFVSGFAPYFVVDRGLGASEAIQGSIELFRSAWGPMLLLWVAIIGLTIIFSNVPVIGAFAMMLVQSAAIGIAYLQLTGQTIGGLDDDGLPRRAPA